MCLLEKQQANLKSLVLYGARSESRTRTPVRAVDFESKVINLLLPFSVNTVMHLN
jgi:hypothetical protein